MLVAPSGTCSGLADEAAALAAAASGWVSNRGLPVIAPRCALLAEHWSGLHALPDTTCPGCRLGDPDGRTARAAGHLRSVATSAWHSTAGRCGERELG